VQAAMPAASSAAAPISITEIGRGVV